MQGGGELLQRQGAQQPREERRGRRARAAAPPHHARHVRGRAGRPPHPPPGRMCGRGTRFLRSTGRPRCLRCGLPHRCCGAWLSMLGGEAIAPAARDVAGWVRLSRCVRQQVPTHVEPVQQAEQCCVTRPGSTQPDLRGRSCFCRHGVAPRRPRMQGRHERVGQQAQGRQSQSYAQHRQRPACQGTHFRLASWLSRGGLRKVLRRL